MRACAFRSLRRRHGTRGASLGSQTPSPKIREPYTYGCALRRLVQFCAPAQGAPILTGCGGWDSRPALVGRGYRELVEASAPKPGPRGPYRKRAGWSCANHPLNFREQSGVDICLRVCIFKGGAMSRPRHPSKEIESAVREAESLGWTVHMSRGHSWGHLYCPRNARDGCRVAVWSTPRNTENHARGILRALSRCPECHGGGDEVP